MKRLALAAGMLAVGYVVWLVRDDPFWHVSRVAIVRDNAGDPSYVMEARR